MTDTTQLVRRLGGFSSFIVCIGSVIGSGIFLVTTDIAQTVSSPLTSLLVWLVAGGISLAGSLIFAELGVMFPRAGGQYVFLREAFHPLIAFLFGWTLVFVIQTGSIAAVAVAFAKFMTKFIPMSEPGMNIAATAVVIALTFFNFLGIKRGSQFLDIVTSFKILALAFFVVAAFLISGASGGTPITMDIGDVTPSAFGVAMVAAFWAFDGWYSLSFVAGEIQNPERNIPRAAFWGIAVVTVLYMLVNLSYFKVLDIEVIRNSQFVAADAAQAIGGQTAVDLIGTLVIISVIGCLNAMIISGARVIYAMGKDHVLPRQFAVVHPNTHSPNRALILQMIWSVILIWSGKFDQLYTYVIFAAFVFYGLTAFAVIFLRNQKDRKFERPYKVPLYPWLPWAYVLFCIVFTLNSVIEKPIESAAGAFIVSLGLPAYYIFKKMSKKVDAMSKGNR